MLEWPKLATKQAVVLTVNNSLWEATILDNDPTNPAARLVRLVDGDSILKPGHVIRLVECFPLSRWAQERGYRMLMVGGQWV